MIKVIEGNILDFKGDALVNSANNELLSGGGVCGVIFKAAGENKLQKECDAIGYCETGHAVITSACDLKNVKYIIHAVPPIYKKDKNAEELLYWAYYRAMQVAYLNNVKSIAFPSLGTGIFGYPLKDASKVAMRAIRDFHNFVMGEMDIYLYALNHDTYLEYFIQSKLTIE